MAWQGIRLIESSKLNEFSDPIATLYFWSGWVGVAFLVFSLLSPKFKKQLGLFALIAGILHSGIFIALDFDFHFDFIFIELSQKYYLYFGALSLLCLLICAIGSFGFFKKFRLYYVVYLALILSLIHWLMIQKILALNYLLIGFGLIILIGYKLLKIFTNKKYNF